MCYFNRVYNLRIVCAPPAVQVRKSGLPSDILHFCVFVDVFLMSEGALSVLTIQLCSHKSHPALRNNLSSTLCSKM